MQLRQDKQKDYFDKRALAQPLPRLSEGQSIRMYDPNSKVWEPGHVVEKTPQPSSYIIQTNKGTYRRNRKHIRKTDANCVNMPESEMNAESDLKKGHDSCVVSQDGPNSPSNSAYVTRSGRTVHKPGQYNG